jgi:hypothetical protein
VKCDNGEVNALRSAFNFKVFAQDFFENCKKSSLASEQVNKECNKILDQKLHSGAGF